MLAEENISVRILKSLRLRITTCCFFTWGNYCSMPALVYGHRVRCCTLSCTFEVLRLFTTRLSAFGTQDSVNNGRNNHRGTSDTVSVTSSIQNLQKEYRGLDALSNGWYKICRVAFTSELHEFQQVTEMLPGFTPYDLESGIYQC